VCGRKLLSGLRSFAIGDTHIAPLLVPPLLLTTNTKPDFEQELQDTVGRDSIILH
jgi:hypothetical protein